MLTNSERKDRTQVNLDKIISRLAGGGKPSKLNGPYGYFVSIIRNNPDASGINGRICSVL